MAFQDGGGAGTLGIRRCDALDCSASTNHDINSTLGGGEDTSATVGGDGLVLVSEHDGGHDTLGIAHCSAVSCATATVVGIAPQLFATSATTGADGLPLISGYDSTAHVVRVVHCSNTFCVPDYRPR